MGLGVVGDFVGESGSVGDFVGVTGSVGALVGDVGEVLLMDNFCRFCEHKFLEVVVFD